jgi:hypothetical protein
MMLLAKAYALLAQNHPLLEELLKLHPKLKEDIPIVTLTILIRLLRFQQPTGAWDGICEVSSYAILALSSLSRLPWIQQLDRGGIIAAIARGKSFLDANRGEWRKGHYLWIEKVTYSSDLLSEVYCLAAALVPIPPVTQTLTIPPTFALPEKTMRAMQSFGSLISRTPLYHNIEPYVLKAAEMQAGYALSALQTRAPNIFPRTAKGEDKYLPIIPLAFTASAAVRGSPASPSVLYDMMILSLLNFLVDEYMEGVIEKDFGEALDSIQTLVQKIFQDLSFEPQETKQTTTEPTPDGLNSSGTGNHTQDSTAQKPTLDNVNAVLRSFLKHILHHPAVISAPSRLQVRLAFELQAFILAHVTHAEDNRRFNLQRTHSSQHGAVNGTNGAVNGNSNGSSNALNHTNTAVLEYQNPGRSFYNWVRITSADHTSCPFSYIFFHCLISASSGSTTTDVFASARTAYLAEDICRHLASLCRIHNDVGSIVRDADEGNVNSINFPEFHISSVTTVTGDDNHGERARADVLWIAEYERNALYSAIAQLEKELPQSSRGDLMDVLQLYVSVTELYGQVYLVKDVGTRTK